MYKRIACYALVALVVGWLGRLYLLPPPSPAVVPGMDPAVRYNKLLVIRGQRELTPSEEREIQELRYQLRYEFLQHLKKLEQRRRPWR